MNAICLFVAGVIRATLPADEFTLAWQHSIEKTRWEEHYRIQGDGLVLLEARIQGMGAGMEPPDDAVLRDGWWTWTPAAKRIDALKLAVSPYVRDWALCWRDGCRPLGALVASSSDGSVVDIKACNASNTSRPSDHAAA